MRILLSDTGKRFNRDWIFRHLSFEFLPGHSYAIVGPNGSGKSTLLQVIAGAVAASEGAMTYYSASGLVEPESAFRQVSIAAPYQELIEEMTLAEFLDFHGRFKPFGFGMDRKRIIDVLGLVAATHKQIRHFSSGMKQRVKLAQAFFSETSCLLLDEPCTNLDENGIALYQELVAAYSRARLVIVSSNDRQEYGFCEETVDVMKHKQ